MPESETNLESITPFQFPTDNQINHPLQPAHSFRLGKSFLFILVFILLVAVGISGYFLGIRKNQSRNFLIAKATIAPSATAIPTPTSYPSIIRLRPSKAPAGTLVAIDGIGFTQYFNLILFGPNTGLHSSGIPNNAIDSVIPDPHNPGSVDFIVPDASFTGPSTGNICDYQKRCMPYLPKTFSEGIYPVAVQNANGQSNTLNFTIIPPADTNTPSPRISGWKTYADTTYNFRIDYPGKVRYEFDQPYTTDVNDNGYTLVFGNATIFFYPNPKNLSATAYAQQEAFKNDLPQWDNNKKPIIPLHLTGIDAVEVNNIQGGAKEFGSEVFIANGTVIIVLRSEEPTQTSEDLLQKMLSTFAFTN